jgi:hypothetical protein
MNLTLIRLTLSSLFMHALLSNPNRQGNNEAFVKDAVGLTDDLLKTLLTTTEEKTNGRISEDSE